MTHIIDFLIFLSKKDIYLYDNKGNHYTSAPLRNEHLDALALETVAAKGMAVGSAEAEVSQEDVNADLATDIYKAEAEL
jgi:hypothetical protein